MKHRGFEILYPELRDSEWLRDHAHLRFGGISQLLGCSPSYAQRALSRFGLGKCPRWDALEEDVFREFYPQYHACFLMQVLQRPKWGVYGFAQKIGLKREDYRRHPYTEEEAIRFWKDWHEYVLRHLPEWLTNGHRERALRLVWRPAEVQTTDCERCEFRESCQGYPLPCMTATVGDWLCSRGRVG